MPEDSRPDRTALAARLRAQDNVISREQALACGLTVRADAEQEVLLFLLERGPVEAELGSTAPHRFAERRGFGGDARSRAAASATLSPGSVPPPMVNQNGWPGSAGS
jgi:hypothetical protein